MSNDLERTLHDLWRGARKQGWTKSRITFTLGWLCPGEKERSDVASEVLADAEWHAAPAEDYEPEMNPNLFLAHTILERPKLSQLEDLLHAARAVARAHDSTIHAIGVGAA